MQTRRWHSSDCNLKRAILVHVRHARGVPFPTSRAPPRWSGHKHNEREAGAVVSELETLKSSDTTAARTRCRDVAGSVVTEQGVDETLVWEARSGEGARQTREENGLGRAAVLDAIVIML